MSSSNAGLEQAAASASVPRLDPFFVIGYKRSGTTMVRLMLNAHPDLAVPPESEYYQRLPPAIGMGPHGPGDLGRLAGVIAALPRSDFGCNLTVDDIRRILQPVLPATTPVILASLYQHWAQVMNKPQARWGDKKPQHWQFVGRLAKLYPAGQFIHVIRDPRDVAASVEEYFPDQVRGRNVLPPHVITAWQWRLANLDTLEQGSHLGGRRYLMFRYEDIVADPQAHARRFCDFLGVAYTPAMLDFHESSGDRRVQGANQQAGPHQQTTRQVHTGRIGRSTASLPESALADIEFICRDLCERFDWPRRHRVSPGRALWLSSACAAMTVIWKMLRAQRRLRGGL